MSRPYPAPTRPLIRFAVLACVPLLGACSTLPKPATLHLTQTQRQPCEAPVVGSLATQGDVDAALVRTAVAWKACAREKQGLVKAIDDFNEAVKPKRRFWFF